MPAYALVELSVHAPQNMTDYREKVGATVAAHGGKYLIRGDNAVVMEGSVGQHPTKVVLEFPDMAAAKAWYHSPAYQAIIKSRTDNSTCNFLLMDGV